MWVPAQREAALHHVRDTKSVRALPNLAPHLRGEVEAEAQRRLRVRGAGWLAVGQSDGDTPSSTVNLLFVRFHRGAAAEDLFCKS